MKWFVVVIKKYAVFTGRARRKEFWMFVLFNIIFGIVAKLLDQMLGLNFGKGMMNGGVINLLFSLFMLVPSLAVTVRRFHDIGKSGWVYFRFFLCAVISALVFVGYVVMLALKEGLNADDLDVATIMKFAMPTLLFAVVILTIGIWQLVYLVRDSQPGENKYGPNPKMADVSGLEGNV